MHGVIKPPTSKGDARLRSAFYTGALAPSMRALVPEFASPERACSRPDNF